MLMLVFLFLTIWDFVGFHYIIVDPIYESNWMVNFIWEKLGKEFIFVWKGFWFVVTCCLTIYIRKRNQYYGIFLMIVANVTVLYAIYKLYELQYYMGERGFL